MASKPIWESTTFWLNLSSAVIMVATASEIVAILPPESLPYIAAVVAVLNILVRVFLTNKAVHL